MPYTVLYRVENPYEPEKAGPWFEYMSAATREDAKSIAVYLKEVALTIKIVKE